MEQDSTVAENGSVLEEFKEANAAKKIINSLPKIVGDQVLVENATELFLCKLLTLTSEVTLWQTGFGDIIFSIKMDELWLFVCSVVYVIVITVSRLWTFTKIQSYSLLTTKYMTLLAERDTVMMLVTLDLWLWVILLYD